jgi:hypothetical protein
MFFNRKVKVTRSTDYFLIETYCHCCYYTCTSNFFFLNGEIMLFIKFFTCFSKNAAKCLWLWLYLNWNKRVRSERRKSHFRGPRFQNLPVEDTPGPLYKCEVLCMHQSTQELDPPLTETIVKCAMRALKRWWE